MTAHLTSLPLLARGKVRDNYAVGDDRMLMVASDRLSAFDVMLAETLPGKGGLLTQMSLFWFDKLRDVCPNHLTGADPESVVAAAEVPLVRGRSMLVKRLRPIAVEAVVRGHLAGSGWDEYRRSGSVCGVPLPAGLQLSSQLPEPTFTPVAKAPAGQHDENISFARLEQQVGAPAAARMRDTSLALYAEAAAFAHMRGVIVADTKFEFGWDERGTLTLMDEVLTPDSSRFWPEESWVVGHAPPGYDKQRLRDWLTEVRIDGLPWDKRPPAPAVPPHVMAEVWQQYRNAFERLTGRDFEWTS